MFQDLLTQDFVSINVDHEIKNIEMAWFGSCKMDEFSNNLEIALTYIEEFKLNNCIIDLSNGYISSNDNLLDFENTPLTNLIGKLKKAIFIVKDDVKEAISNLKSFNSNKIVFVENANEACQYICE